MVFMGQYGDPIEQKQTSAEQRPWWHDQQA